MAKIKEHICFECSKKIDADEHMVCISTYNRTNPDNFAKLPDDHTYFHFQCFVDNFNNNVERKARIIVDNMQQNALSIVNTPLMQSILKDINGMNKIQKMLNINLLSTKDKVVKKIDNGRRKPKRKKKM